ncbi:MAG: OmpH family outer membrane protein [Flavobacteriales bacterium]|nr:OmpH family outer membrane protein [Flavobacteriales bacterium]
MLAKISLSISVLLAIAFGYLFWKTSKTTQRTDSDEPVKVAQAFQGDSVKATVVAFVNGDSLNANYRFISEKSKDLELKLKAADERVQKAFGSRQEEYQRLIEYAQTHPDMPESEALALQESIGALEAELNGIQQREVGALKKKEAELQEQLQNRVNTFLKKFSKERGIDYVINQQSDFQILLYGSDAYDITSEVIAGLNAEYEAELSQKNP